MRLPSTRTMYKKPGNLEMVQPLPFSTDGINVYLCFLP